MRTLLTTLGIGLAAALLSGPPAACQERDEYTDLFARDLRDWSRSGSGKNPWRLTADRTTLSCANASEVYIPERDFWDGTLKFEYRFTPTGQKTGYKAAVWARRTIDGTGCRVALGDDCGTMTASFQGSSDRVKTVEWKPAASPAHPVGEWNEVTIHLKGKAVDVVINGKLVASFTQSDMKVGLIALEAEGSEVEFRRVRWKEAE